MFLQKTAPKNARNVVISTKINISLREKEKTVSLVLLPTQPQLNPKAVVAVSLILSTLCRYKYNSHLLYDFDSKIYAR